MALLTDEAPPPPGRGGLIAGALVVIGLVAAGVYYARRPVPAADPLPRASAPTSSRSRPGTTRPTPRPSTGAPETAEATPEPKRAPALRVEADVSGALVFLDRKQIGTAPVEVTTLEPGRHRVNVSAEGYEMHAEDFDAGDAPRVIVVKFKEVRLSESIPVVHKHTAGSCKGTLSATPAGLRFQGSGGHTLAAPLSSLQQFEVDYLAKNLRLKTGDKTWNFTDDTPNADALFTFHKSVDSARARLR